MMFFSVDITEFLADCEWRLPVVLLNTVGEYEIQQPNVMMRHPIKVETM